MAEETSARAPAGIAVSAIVVSYRTGPVLFDCLGALLADPDIADIVLVDNGNPPETLARIEVLRVAHHRLQLVGGGINRGFGAGVNLGVRAAAGQRLLILNPDAVLRPGSVAALEAARAGGTEPIVVGGRIFHEDGTEQRGARRRRLTLATAAATFLGLERLGLAGLNRNREPMPAEPVPMQAVSGALMYLSREGFDQLGGFDEGYFLHVEDLDICRRAELAGGSVIFTPHAGALHAGATSDAPSLVVERHKAAGFARYFRKFSRGPLERIAAEALIPLISAALMLRARWRGRTPG